MIKLSCFTSTLSRVLLLWLFVSCFLFCQAQPSETMKSVHQRWQSHVVSIRATIQLHAGATLGVLLGSEQEMQNETQGLLVGRHGLILCSSTQLSGLISLQKHLMGQLGQQLKAQLNPESIEVLLEGRGSWLKAELLARDSELDLAWLKLPTDPQAGYPGFNWAEEGTAEIGDTLLLAKRLDRYFDRVLTLNQAMIGGVTEKPRRLYIPSVQMDTAFGLPALDSSGRLVGLTILQMPAWDASSQTQNALVVLNKNSNLRDILVNVILPVKTLKSATERALRQSQEGALLL